MVGEPQHHKGRWPLIVSFGGTFDPVHLGHVAAAQAASEALGGARVNLILSARPSHRAQTGANIAQRLAMLDLACADHPLLRVDERECHRESPSYTVDTLLELSQESPGETLVWVIGSDAYHLLPTWYRWQEVLKLAHLLVLERVGYPQAPVRHQVALSALEAQRRTTDLARLQTPLSGAGDVSGCIYRLPVALPDISASQIRSMVSRGLPVAHLLPAGVGPYIRDLRLYTAVPKQ